MLGAEPDHSLRVSQQVGPGRPGSKTETNAENAGIKKFLEDMDKEPGYHRIEHLDVNGDGREDLVVSRQTLELDPRTDVFLFLRGSDNRLPERPTQVLHCSGFPVQVGSNQQTSAFCDLDGDGRSELLLFSPRTVFMSSSGVMEMVLSRGMDLVLNIRTFHQNGYSLSPDATLGVRSMVLPGEIDALFLVDGDFNGDGRRDLLVKRSASEWDVYLSSAAGGWFLENPRLKFDIPMDGHFTIQDLNGDGISDL